ncbi:MAG: cytochrome c [Bryobacterales bacterium]|nr:cytochrome c [Bryobacterales bacterium]
MHCAFLAFAFTGTVFAADPAFYRDVLPILAEKCQICHRPGEAGPMPLLTYAQVRPWAKAIRESVAMRRMPPWHADNSVARYSNDLSLTEAQRALLIQWADAGQGFYRWVAHCQARYRVLAS